VLWIQRLSGPTVPKVLMFIMEVNVYRHRIIDVDCYTFKYGDFLPNEIIVSTFSMIPNCNNHQSTREKFKK